MPRPGQTKPDLVSELRRMQDRLSAVERRPVLGSAFDTYPCMEWETTSRPRQAGNVWTSCGIANVTGVSFDRVEAKFTADRIIPARSEVEIRIAAFRHPHDTFAKECIGASSAVRLTGNYSVVGTKSGMGGGKWRWIHGLPYGWDADETGDSSSIYTIELQHRNPDDCTQTSDSTWDGAYKISNMHYCAGLPEEQIPDASESGWFWYAGGDYEVVRQADTEEAFMTY